MATLKEYMELTEKLRGRSPKTVEQLGDELLGRVKPEQIQEPEPPSTEFIRQQRETLYGKLDR